jgi:hypothetical protein
MTKKSWILVGCALVLAVTYACFFTDWFKPATIQISHTARPLPSRSSRSAMTVAVAFGLDRDYRLTEVKIVPLAEWQTNQSVLPLWHLVSDPRSAPTRFFSYGQNIDGMKPAMPGTKPKPLEMNVAYRLFVSAGSVKGRHDFEIGGKPTVTSTNQ